MRAIAGTYPPSLRAGIHPAEFSHGIHKLRTCTRGMVRPPIIAGVHGQGAIIAPADRSGAEPARHPDRAGRRLVGGAGEACWSDLAEQCPVKVVLRSRLLPSLAHAGG